MTAQRIWNSGFFRAARMGGRFFSRAATVGVIAAFAFDAVIRIYSWWTSAPPSPSVAKMCDDAIDFFSEHYLPETAQQLQAAMIAVAHAGGNPAKLVQELFSADPWALSPLPAMGADGQAGVWKDLLPTLKFRRPAPWAALGVLVGGTFADLALGME